jgi:hypothetical protein
VVKLHLLPGGRCFESHQTYGLTYASYQESEKFRGLCRHLATEIGTDEAW